jgi:hypothetical protein
MRQNPTADRQPHAPTFPSALSFHVKPIRKDAPDTRSTEQAGEATRRRNPMLPRSASLPRWLNWPARLRPELRAIDARTYGHGMTFQSPGRPRRKRSNRSLVSREARTVHCGRAGTASEEFDTARDRSGVNSSSPHSGHAGALLDHARTPEPQRRIDTACAETEHGQLLEKAESLPLSARDSTQVVSSTRAHRNRALALSHVKRVTRPRRRPRRTRNSHARGRRLPRTLIA